MNSLFNIAMLALFAAGWAGCASNKASEPEAVVDVDRSLAYLGPEVRPENLLFPDFLFTDDLALGQHGRIPGTPLIGAGMTGKKPLKEFSHRYTRLLAQNGWSVTLAEFSPHAFRLQATTGSEALEIRGVQGTGPTCLFLLYHPSSATL